MSLDDYRLADCTLFRVPPVQVSTFQESIEEALVNSWRNGYGVDRAIDTVLSDRKITGALEERVAANLEFQRKQQITKMKGSASAKISSYTEEKHRTLDQLDSDYHGKISTIGKERKKAYADLIQTEQSCSAAERRLQELRARVQDRLHELGGERGLATLLAINSSVTGPGLEEHETVKSEYPQQHTQAVTLPLEAPDAPQQDPGFYGHVRKVCRTVWKVLNYRIF